MMGLWGKESTYTKLLQRISEKNEEGLELRRQSLQNGRMYHWILSKVLKMAELIEVILSKENLNRAYKKVVANKGASGVDGVTVEKGTFFIF